MKPHQSSVSAKGKDPHKTRNQWNDANESKYLGNSHRLRAELLLLDGKRDEALAELSESFRLGYYLQWWYVLNEDPTWAPLHGEARFKTIVLDVHRYIDDQRRELEIMRQQGIVPKRGLTARD